MMNFACQKQVPAEARGHLSSYTTLSSLFAPLEKTKSSTYTGEFLSETCWFPEPEDPAQLLLT